MDIQDKIRNHVSSGNLDKALDEFIQWSAPKDGDLHNSLILIKGQYTKLKRDENLGIIGFSEASRDRNRIANSILELTSQIDILLNLPQAVMSGEGNIISGPAEAGTTKMTILFLASNPSNTGKLQLEKEFLRVFQSLREGDELYRLETEFAITPSDLQRVMLKHRPNVIHFSGHGTGNGNADTRAIGKVNPPATAGIILQDSEGKSKLISGAALAGLFGICLRKFKIDVVVLNACHSEEQAKAIFEAGVPYVVGMNTAIKDDTAIEFSTGFYRGISTEGGDIEFAFDLALNAIMLQGLSGDDIPVLYKK